MKIQITPTTDRHWSIAQNGNSLGSVERLMTGYLVTLSSADGDRKIKRYRMIDALREALGAEAELDIASEPKSS